MDSKHTCPVDGCKAMLPFEKCPCFFHWTMVPRTLQEALYRAWDYGHVRDTAAYLRTRSEAVEAVNAQLRAAEAKADTEGARLR